MQEPNYQSYPIINPYTNAAGNPVPDHLFNAFELTVNRMIQDTIPQIKEINDVPGIPSRIEQETIAANYVIPELFILNSKLYQAYVKRNNLIFSYLQNHEDFYRMSEYYLSHENPSIRSINKLLRDNQTKSVDNAASQWIEEMKKASENIRALQKENEDTVLNNLRTYIQFENTLFQQKASEYQNLKNEITRLKGLSLTNKSDIDQKTLQTIKTENLGKTDIEDKITEIQIILFRLDEKTNQILKAYLDTSAKYNENENNSNSAHYQNMIEEIGQLISFYKEDDQNETVLNETLTQIQGLSKIEDEEKKAKQTENLKKRLNTIQLVKKKIITTLGELIEKSNKLNKPFYVNYLESLKYIKCMEMKMITSISKMKLNSNEECEKRDINTTFDEFKMTTRSILSKQIAKYRSQIEQIKQKQTEVSTNNSQSEKNELDKEIRKLKLDKESSEKRLLEVAEEIQQIESTTGLTGRTNTQTKQLTKLRQTQETLRDTTLPSIKGQIEGKETELKNLQSSKRNIEKKTKSYTNLLLQKTTDLNKFETTSKSVFDSIGKAYILINRVNNMLEAMKKKKDEMDKKKSNNRLLQAMQSDMLFKEVNSLLSAKSLGNAKYKLVIGKSAKDFKKRIPILKKYFESKNKFYENRGSILSALSFNVNAIASAFTNETPKNISFNEKQFADIFTSPSTQNVKPMNYATSTQSQFGAPSPTAYAVQQQPYNPPPQRPAMFGGYMGQGGATQMNKPPEKKSISSYEFITILDKVFEDLKGKVRSNEVYENRLNVFLKFLDERDRQLNEEILAKLNRVEKISKPEYEFIFPAQIKFITRRVFRIQDFMNTPRNNSQMKHIYMTDFILMYFSLHYILSNFLDLILKPQAFNELNA
jgi:hypothetical protein